jgi:hypothetical protein
LKFDSMNAGQVYNARMVFSYYRNLSPGGKLIYEQSDAIVAVPLPDAEALRPLIPLLSAALLHEDREQAEDVCRKLAAGITASLSFSPYASRFWLSVRQRPGVNCTDCTNRPADGLRRSSRSGCER